MCHYLSVCDALGPTTNKTKKKVICYGGRRGLLFLVNYLSLAELVKVGSLAGKIGDPDYIPVQQLPAISQIKVLAHAMSFWTSYTNELHCMY